MNTFLQYFRTWFHQKFKVPIGIFLVSMYFVLVTFADLVNRVSSVEALKNYPPLSLIFDIGIIISSIGLLMKRGWGRNFIIFFNTYFLITGLIRAFGYYYYTEYAGNISRLIAIIILNALIYGSIYIYLFSKEIRELYSQSSTSQFIIGFSLVGYTWTDQSDVLPGIIKGILMIVGFAIIAKEGRDSRKDAPL